MDKLLSALSMAKRAGKLVLGFDAVVSEIKSGRAYEVFLAKDLSEKTKKEICFFMKSTNTEPKETQVTMEQAEQALGRRYGVFAVTDKELAKLARIKAQEI